MKNISKIGLLSLSVVALAACSNQNQAVTTTNSSAVASQAAAISLEEAKALALKAAGATEASVTNLTTGQDTHMGQAVYEIDFDYQGQEYSYSISQADGSILEQSNEPSDNQAASGTAASSSSASSASAQSAVSTYKVTRDQAQELALKDAGLAASAVTNLVVTEDTENGQAVYEVEFNHNGQEYSYTLDGQTGAVLAKEQDQD